MEKAENFGRPISEVFLKPATSKAALKSGFLTCHLNYPFF